MAYVQDDPVELIARHQHECWVSWAKSIERMTDVPPKILEKWESRFVPFDLLSEQVQEGFRHRARMYVEWVKDSLLLS